jgi:hypothetical protein
MPAIVRSALFACLAVVCSGARLYAGPEEDIVKLLGSMAAALTTVNVPEFMDAFDKNMPEYEKLRSDVTGLVNQADVASSIEPISNNGDDNTRSVDLDWYIEVRSLVQDGPIVTRRETVHCEFRKDKKKWKIVSLKPLEFFAPAAPPAK